MKNSRFHSTSLILALALLASACNLPGGAVPDPVPVISGSNPTPVISTPAAASPTAAADTSAAPAASEAPAVATDTPEPPAPTPVEPPQSFVSKIVDTDTQPTAKDGYAAGGDSLSIDRFERPFNQDMSYRPDVDIQTATLASSQDWFFVTVNLAGPNPASGKLDASYAVELDVNNDGRGEFLVWAGQPYAADWSKAAVSVYTTSTHKVGGPRPLQPDAPWSGATYDTLLFKLGAGDIPGAAWARLNPQKSNSVQIAFKAGIAGSPGKFMWGVYADDGVKDPAKFDYNDAFTLEQAGSPLKTNASFPLKDLYALDNTCRAVYGFTPTGPLPGLCDGLLPTAVPTKTPTPTQSSPGGINGTVYVDTNANGAQDSGESGYNAFPLYLFANNSCSGSSVSSTTPDSNGHYMFPNLAPGSYCVDLFYSGSPVKPANPQVANVTGGHISTLNFGVVPPP